MPQIIACEWRVIFSENLLHKTVYPLKDPWYRHSLCIQPHSCLNMCSKPSGIVKSRPAPASVI